MTQLRCVQSLTNAGAARAREAGSTREDRADAAAGGRSAGAREDAAGALWFTAR